MYHVYGSHEYTSFRSPRFQLRKTKVTEGFGCCALGSAISLTQRPRVAPSQWVNTAGCWCRCYPRGHKAPLKGELGWRTSNQLCQNFLVTALQSETFAIQSSFLPSPPWELDLHPGLTAALPSSGSLPVFPNKSSLGTCFLENLK